MTLLNDPHLLFSVTTSHFPPQKHSSPPFPHNTLSPLANTLSPLAARQDNSSMPRLYLTGVYYFIMMYTGSNILPIAKYVLKWC